MKNSKRMKQKKKGKKSGKKTMRIKNSGIKIIDVKKELKDEFKREKEITHKIITKPELTVARQVKFWSQSLQWSQVSWNITIKNKDFLMLMIKERFQCISVIIKWWFNNRIKPGFSSIKFKSNYTNKIFNFLTNWILSLRFFWRKKWDLETLFGEGESN